MTLQKSRSEIMQICSQTKGVAFSLQGGGCHRGTLSGREAHASLAATRWKLHWGVCVCVCVCCSVQFFATQWTVVHQAPLSMGFSRQEYFSRGPSQPRD